MGGFLDFSPIFLNKKFAIFFLEENAIPSIYNIILVLATYIFCQN
jgi:hypothetical protein